MGDKVLIKGKLIGEICEDTYITYRRPAEHFYRIGQGYPISSNLLDKLNARGVRFITIVVRECGRPTSYRIQIEKYLAAFPFNWKDYDEQKCVKLKDMEKL